MTNRRLILALAGGVGGGKLARGLADVLPAGELAVAVNTADDFEHWGLHICPDIDSVLYAMAGLNDLERGWGLAGETWNVMAAMQRLGGETWFQLGDNDLATHLWRTRALAAGESLSDVTAALARRLGITHAVLPMSDNPVRSFIGTDEGTLEFQDYFVKRQCRPVFKGVEFRGAEAARPSTALRDALDRATAVVIAPSNPFVSIDPMLALPGLRGALRRPGRPVIGISPIVGGAAVKGPLAKMMREAGIDPSPLGIAGHYGALVDGWIVDAADRSLVLSMQAMGLQVKVCDTIMRGLDDKRRLAQDAVDFAAELSLERVA